MFGTTSTHLLLLLTLFSILVPSIANNHLPTRSTSQNLLESLTGRSPADEPILARELNLSNRRSVPQKRKHGVLGKRLTNAQRLARGLPISAPVLKKRGATARRTLPSNTPKVTVKGLLWCNYANGTQLGWLLPDRSSGNVYGTFTMYKHGWGSALEFLNLEFSYDPTAGANVVREELEFLTPKEPAPAYGYLGAAKGLLGPDTPDLGADEHSFSMVTSTVSYGPGALPVIGPNAWSDALDTETEVEAAIWTYLPATKEVGVKWINSDHSKVSAQFWRDAWGSLYIGVDSTLFNARPYFPSKVDVLKCYIDDAFVPYNGKPYPCGGDPCPF